MNAIELRDLRRGYESGPDVIRGIGLDVRPGEVVALLGRNGAGKTTLLRLVMGMLRPSAGSVRVLGYDPRHEPVRVKRQVGYVSEEQILPADLSVAAVLDLHRKLFPSWDDAFEHSLCDRFELSPRTRIGTLSKGQARQVALICAIAHRPPLLLLDEPAGGLDPAARREILESAIALLSEQGTTVLFSSHHMADVERIAARVVLLERGLVLIDSELDALKESYSLAVLPLERTTHDELRAVDGCVSVRRKADGWYAVFARAPQEAQSMVASKLATSDFSCRTLPLEDLFIELVKDRS